MQLLKVFVFENLATFEEFHSQNQAFMEQHGKGYHCHKWKTFYFIFYYCLYIVVVFVDFHTLGFNYPSLVAKMRQLTLSSMAVSKDVISLSSLREELKLGQEELEEFIIDCTLRGWVGVLLEEKGGGGGLLLQVFS